MRDIADEAVRHAQWILRTPVMLSDSLTATTGGPVSFKAENLQRTGSFKLRGAMAKLAALGNTARAGVVAGSAGNHALALAFAARVAGVPCRVVMPASASVAKMEAAQRYGAEVVLDGDTVDDSVAVARSIATRDGAAFVHPFDDLDVITGQATLGLELLEQVPKIARIVVPVGGGGLASGIGLAAAASELKIQIIGVQAAACPWVARAFSDGRGTAGMGATLADGIAVKHPGGLTLPLLRRFLDDVIVVDESQIAAAMTHLAEHEKLVVEGAGAVAVAALLAGILPPTEGETVAVLSGGNVDLATMEALLRRHETLAGRRLVVFTRIDDHPGGLARLVSMLAGTGANVVEVTHVRDGLDLGVLETGLQVVLQTRGQDHAESVVRAMTAAGYVLQSIPQPPG
jgi:threonine dehydratase